MFAGHFQLNVQKSDVIKVMINSYQDEKSALMPTFRAGIYCVNL